MHNPHFDRLKVAVLQVAVLNGELRVEILDPQVSEGEFSEPPPQVARSVSQHISDLKGREFQVISLWVPDWPNLDAMVPGKRDFLRPARLISLGTCWCAWDKAYRLISALTRAREVPFCVIDRSDSTVLDPRIMRFLNLATLVFKREFPRNAINLFLYSTPRDIEPWRNLQRFGATLSKIKPISLGLKRAQIPPSDLLLLNKDIDVFWAGNSSICPVRWRGIELLGGLKENGLNVFIPDEPLSKMEFLEKVARSFLVWSPEGIGYQCYRTFEAALCASVPVLSHPTIWQHAPFENGLHSIHYSADGDDLVTKICLALKNRETLKQLGRDSLEWASKNHLLGLEYSRAVNETLDAFSNERQIA